MSQKGDVSKTSQTSNEFKTKATMEMIGGLLVREACNAFGLMVHLKAGKERKMRLYAEFVQDLMFYHDCLPNACWFEYLD
jgi:hypothetical protein